MRLAIASLLSICMAAAFPIAEACSRRVQPTDAQLFSEAEHVFVAKVVATTLRQVPRRQCEAEELNEDECAYVEGRYELVQTLKGTPRRRGTVRDLVFGPGNCSLGLLAGFYYVFYMDRQHNWVPHINGSFPLGPFFEARERQAVDRIREPPHMRPQDQG